MAEEVDTVKLLNDLYFKTVEQVDEMNASIPFTSATCFINVLYMYNDETKSGVHIPMTKIIELTITEDLFGHFPRLTMRIQDDGAICHSVGLLYGKNIYLKITPRGFDDDSIPAPYFESVFTLQAFREIYDSDSDSCSYVLEAVVGPMKFFNNICVWPTKDDPTNLVAMKLSTSKDTIEAVAQLAGLKCDTTDILDTMDMMVWLNTNHTHKEFIDHLIAHSWMDDHDALLYYIDREGTFRLTSIESLCSYGKKADYIDATLYDTKFKEDGTVEQYYRAYTDIMVDDIGYVNSLGGYKTRQYVYNPYNMLEPEMQVPTIFDSHIADFALNSVLSYKSYPPKEVVKNPGAPSPGEANTQFPGVSNKSTSDAGNIRYISNDMHFRQTHMYYDVAPLHNMNIIRSFFQFFVYLTVNTNTQVTLDLEESQRVKLGDKIGINFESKMRNKSVLNGSNSEFIVCGITHTWTQGGAYTLMLNCVRDTITGARVK